MLILSISCDFGVVSTSLSRRKDANSQHGVCAIDQKIKSIKKEGC